VALVEAGRAAPGGVHGVFLVQFECICRSRDGEPHLHVPIPFWDSRKRLSKLGLGTGRAVLGLFWQVSSVAWEMACSSWEGKLLDMLLQMQFRYVNEGFEFHPLQQPSWNVAI